MMIKSNLFAQESQENKRFVKISQREDRCDLPKSVWRPLTENAYFQTWKGVTIDKDPTQIAAYPMLLYELRPKTIIELGALKGGSAIWLADNLEIFGIEGKVYSVDVDLDRLDETAKADSRIHFLEGDCNKINIALKPELLSDLPHPWLIIEDAHVNMVGVVEYFHENGLQSGDYLIVEDTNKFMWEVWLDWDDQAYIELGLQKVDDFRKWLMKHENDYEIDTFYQDMYGYNASKNWNSILKRV
ncbi:MAG: cephalosporin hydroxylase [Hormoscilla sp. GUM202]|nr:cephalosporin hydroxylase [Hormoscilla sp. GUM202]